MKNFISLNFCLKSTITLENTLPDFYSHKLFSVNVTIKIKIITLTSTKFSPEKCGMNSVDACDSRIQQFFFTLTKGEFFPCLYLWALHELISGDASQFRIKIDQSERDTRGRPLLKLHKSFLISHVRQNFLLN